MHTFDSRYSIERAHSYDHLFAGQQNQESGCLFHYRENVQVIDHGDCDIETVFPQVRMFL